MVAALNSSILLFLGPRLCAEQDWYTLVGIAELSLMLKPLEIGREIGPSFHMVKKVTPATTILRSSTLLMLLSRTGLAPWLQG